MTEWLLDASAVLAYLNVEPGGSAIEELLPDAAISAVNLVEVITKRMERDGSRDQVRDAVALLGIEVIPFGEREALEAGSIHAEYRRAGLSLADAACIATARALGATPVTADRAWAALPDRIQLIR